MDTRPWLRHYDKGVPARLQYPSCTIQDFLLEQARRNPQSTALICNEDRMSYIELAGLSRKFAMRLVQSGLCKGDRVAICLPNSIEFVIAFYGILMAGGLVAAMNPVYPLPEWQYQAGIVNPKVIIGLTSRKMDLEDLCRSASIDTLCLFGGLPVEENWQFIEIGKHKSTKDIEIKAGLPSVTAEDPAVLQFSGGTTGLPKAALATHHNVAANILQFRTWLTPLREGTETFLTVIPLYHVYGMVIGLNVGIALGAAIVLVPDGRDLDRILSLAELHHVTFLPGVPSLYHAISRHPRVQGGKVNLRSIKACISGSAPLLETTRLEFEALTGGKLVEGYGLSEAPTATHCNPLQGENRSGSIGLPLPDVDCRILAPEGGGAVPLGEEGELWIRSPQVMREYLDSPVETADALQDGWLKTGDIARMDADGYFYITGRLKDLIKVNGLQVWPTEVENALMRYPAVLEAGVSGISDAESGEAVKAWLVTAPGMEVRLGEIADFCKQSLAGYKVPTQWMLVKSLPKSPVGKLLRRELIHLHEDKK